MPNLRVHFLPELLSTDELAGSSCVVIDVLRATTTAIEALASGARAVVPCLTIEDARRRAAEYPRGEVVLGGERGGLPIPGFDLGNSPAEYVPEAVGGKTVVLTTTNGTKALLQCRQAVDIMIGAFVNLAAICGALAGRELVDLVCAGTDGQITREDVLFAGAVVAQLGANNPADLNDQAAIARDAWLRIMAHAAPHDIQPRLVDVLRASRGGRNLIALNMGHDIELAAAVDRFAAVPHYDFGSGSIQMRPQADITLP